jgi:histidyl-tRNA synthetase
MEARRTIEWRMRETARRWGYREVCTPEFEDLELFTMRSGEGIVEEMYVFEDKGGRKLALRPEITASVIRMYINEAKVAPKPLRWCYFADCFRYERPQKGRYRQFWQFGVELMGRYCAGRCRSNQPCSRHAQRLVNELKVGTFHS